MQREVLALCTSILCRPSLVKLKDQFQILFSMQHVNFPSVIFIVFSLHGAYYLVIKHCVPLRPFITGGSVGERNILLVAMMAARHSTVDTWETPSKDGGDPFRLHMLK